MKLYVIPKGTKVCLGNGDGELKVFKTTKEFTFSDYVCDPIYAHNNWGKGDVMPEIIMDPTLREKPFIVAKYDLKSLNDAIDYGYKFVYVNFKDVKTLC